MDLTLLRNRTFVATNVTALVMMFGMLGGLFVLTLFLQVVLEVSAIKTGLTMTPPALAMMVSAEKAGNASGTVNTMRQIGSVLGVSVLGAILQNQLVTRVADAVSQSSLPIEVKARVVQGLNSGLQVQAVSSMAGDSGPLAAQMRQLFIGQFVASLNRTILIGAAVLLAGAFVALSIQSHSTAS